MQNKAFFIVTKEHIRKIRQKLMNHDKWAKAQDDLKQILKIKDTLFWHGDSPGGCAGVHSSSGELLRQVELMESILHDLAEKDIDRAISKMDWYEENGVIPEDEREIKIVKERLNKERDKNFFTAQDQVEELLEFEEYFYSCKNSP